MYQSNVATLVSNSFNDNISGVKVSKSLFPNKNTNASPSAKWDFEYSSENGISLSWNFLEKMKKKMWGRFKIIP